MKDEQQVVRPVVHDAENCDVCLRSGARRRAEDEAVKANPVRPKYHVEVDAETGKATANVPVATVHPDAKKVDELGPGTLLSKLGPVSESPVDLMWEAASLVRRDRQEAYDHPLPNHERIARIWSGILDMEVTAEQAALCMLGVKLAREAYRPKRDNIVDAHGYLLVYGEILRERERRAS